MSHVVLLGDSIFDDGRYVPGGPAVIEHLRKALAGGGKIARAIARPLVGHNFQADGCRLLA